MHYHIFMGAAQAAPMATTTIEDYDESLRIFLSLSKGIYGTNKWFKEGINYRNLLEATEYGEPDGPITLGTSSLCVQWFPCPANCISPSWN